MPKKNRAAAASAALESEEVQRLRVEFARTLHDGPCQTLAGIGLMARVLSRKLENEQPARAREVAELSELVERAGGELRALIRAIGPKEGKP